MTGSRPCRRWPIRRTEPANFLSRMAGLRTDNMGLSISSSRGPSEGPNGSIDMDKLKQCLQSMDPMQAARVMHAVQMMQAMEAMLKRRRSRAEEAEEAAW